MADGGHQNGTDRASDDGVAVAMQLPSYRSLVDHSAVRTEVMRHAIKNRGMEAASNVVGFHEVAWYKLENFVSSNKRAPFYMLSFITLVCILIFGRIWQAISIHPDETFWHGCWMSFQIIVSQGADDKIREAGTVATVLSLLLIGMLIFAVLIGMITEAFSDSFAIITEGKTAVAASGHTLILGWNEATVRTICQVAFLRRQWRLSNSTFLRKWLFIGRVPASTPVAKEPIVIMCNSKTKGEMEEAIKGAFEDRGISPQRTKLGWDVVCRVGDPTNIQDLHRVGAARATSIMVQMTDEDDREEETYDGHLHNGMTLRTLLALRYTLFTAAKEPDWDSVRVVVQLRRPSEVIEAATFSAPSGRRVVLLQDLTRFLNNLMFACTAQPGLADVLCELMGFEGAAVRARRADTFPEKGASVVGKTVSDAAFAFQDAIVLGVIGRDGDAITPGVVNLDEGICPTGSRVIAPDDRVIYLSEKPVPKVLKQPPASAARESTSRRRSSMMLRKLNILVCGWRIEWDQPERIHRRLMDTLGRLEPGSHMTFLTHHSPEDFLQLIEEAEIPHMVKQEEDGWQYMGQVTMWHRQGEPCMVDELRPVLTEMLYDRAIVMTDVSLSTYSRDTRVLNVMMLLRWIQEKLEQPAMSVVAENALDQTARLAVAPADKTRMLDPDFVNMQAIQARALTQCLAYPRIEPAVAELFSCQPLSPDIVMMAQVDYLLPGSEMPFYEVQVKVKEICPEDICIGWRRKSGKIRLCPEQQEILKVENTGLLILLTRSEGDRRLRPLMTGALQGEVGEGGEEVPPQPATERAPVSKEAQVNIPVGPQNNPRQAGEVTESSQEPWCTC